jgi:selenocysteine-specific elongation factor
VQGAPRVQVSVPEGLSEALGCHAVQFTLVDCPGHASLIRTILGGVQIIDIMLLVVDVTKGTVPDAS